MQSVAIPSISNLEELISNILLSCQITSREYLWLLNAAPMSSLTEADQVLIDRVFYGIRHGLLQIVDSRPQPVPLA